ncbi:MAG: stage 0 sporulation protein [Endomicrobium sp.]|jgi:cell fate regulator YaaT (PSP1 superfamily)|nr:stage 0 sporulation protein [Endomicrobium sp.]
MSMVVKVIVRKIKDEIYVDAGHWELKLNDKIIVETEHGIEFGFVCAIEKSMPKDKKFIGKVLRKFTKEDKKKLIENDKKSLKARATVIQKIREYKLDMKLTFTNYTFDRSKLFIYYTSETRIDFRKLIKVVGHILKTRIQMVQIGVRDKSKIIGGIGNCGQVLCCHSFLKDFSSVTVDMAKEQELTLNIVKLSGLCGRLMCCISYENDIYKNIKRDLPEIGTVILTPEGKAKLVAIDCMKEKIVADFGDKEFKIFTIKQIKDYNKLQ